MKKHKNFYNKDDREYIDGYGVDRRRDNTVDKRKERRFNRALKVKNVSDLLDEDEDDDYNTDYINDRD